MLRRSALYKGLLGGNRFWIGVGFVLWVPRLTRRAFGKRPQIIAVEKLTAGQFVRLESIPAPTRKQRKAIRRAK